MCETCGCGNPDGFKIHGPYNTHNLGDDHLHEHEHEHDHGHGHTHSHAHSHDDDHKDSHDHIHQKTVNLNVDILSSNNLTAGLNRRFFEGRRVLCLNLVSSPGSGKTTLLEKTVISLIASNKIYVIEGDQQTHLDADRIAKTGATAIQINTGSGCHLDAKMVETAVDKLDIATNSILFIENVGNLVCPAMFDLGEQKRVVVVSTTEGEDKPVKYPNMFETSHLCIINKSDLLPYVDFRLEEFIKNTRIVNPDLEVITVSAKTGEGMDKWFEWIFNQQKN